MYDNYIFTMILNILLYILDKYSNVWDKYLKYIIKVKITCKFKHMMNIL